MFNSDHFAVLFCFYRRHFARKDRNLKIHTNIYSIYIFYMLEWHNIFFQDRPDVAVTLLLESISAFNPFFVSTYYSEIFESVQF